MRIKTFIFLLLLATLLSCKSGQQHHNASPAWQMDVLSTPFSDMGAWFCISLPEHQSLGLGIPLILSDSNGYLLDGNFMLLSTDKIKADAFIIKNYTQPGRIIQEAENPDLQIKIVSIFSNKHTVLLSCSFTNKKDKARNRIY